MSDRRINPYNPPTSNFESVAQPSMLQQRPTIAQPYYPNGGTSEPTLSTHIDTLMNPVPSGQPTIGAYPQPAPSYPTTGQDAIRSYDYTQGQPAPQMGTQPNPMAMQHANQNASFMRPQGGMPPQMGGGQQRPQMPPQGQQGMNQGMRPQMPPMGFMGQNPQGQNELLQRLQSMSQGKGGQQQGMQQPPQMGQYTPPNNMAAPTSQQPPQQPTYGAKGGR